MSIAAATVTGPGWTDIMIAFGTVGAVIVAVGIALWTEWRSGTRLTDERKRSDRLPAEERARAKAELEEERAYGKAQLDEERGLAREREQLVQAYAVRVQLARRGAGAASGGAQPRRLAALIRNKGDYTITGVDVRFSGLGGELLTPQDTARIPASPDAAKLRNGFEVSSEVLAQDVLAPWDEGIRFETGVVPPAALDGPYVIARWTDRWGTRWEHSRGRVRRIRDDEPWEP